MRERRMKVEDINMDLSVFSSMGLLMNACSDEGIDASISEEREPIRVTTTIAQIETLLKTSAVITSIPLR